MVDRYSAAIVQYMRVNPDEIPDFAERRKVNLARVLASFQSLETWEETIPVKLTVFPENILRHEYDEADPKQDQKMRVASAIEMPGPETDAIAGMAKKWNTYVSASLHERDPEFPDYYFNTAFIMNPKGQIVLKYRKINPWIPLELTTSPHDVIDTYKAPLFPVAKTELGNLACMVCYDQFFPEVARQLAFNGAESFSSPPSSRPTRRSSCLTHTTGTRL